MRPRSDMVERTCRTCGETKPSGEYHKGRRRLDCKLCATANTQAWARLHQEQIVTYSHSPVRLANKRTWNRAHLEERRAYDHSPARRAMPLYGKVYSHATSEAKRARSAVRRELKAGRMVRPDTCSRCRQHAKMIEAAHHDYSKQLDIEWLCRTCHRIEDAANPKGGTHRIAGAALTSA